LEKKKQTPVTQTKRVTEAVLKVSQSESRWEIQEKNEDPQNTGGDSSSQGLLWGAKAWERKRVSKK